MTAPQVLPAVMHVAHAWPPAAIGGVELYAAALYEASARAGMRVARFTPADVPGRARRARRSPLEAHHRDPVAREAFEAALARFEPDVVHVHHLSGLGMELLDAARAAGVRVVVTLHDDWLACARGQRVDLELRRCEGPSVERCARCLAPDLWAPVPPPVARSMPTRVGAVRRRHDAWARAQRAVDLFLAPSPHFVDRLGVEAEHLPLPLLRPVAPATIAEPGPVRFLFLGSRIPTKGPDLAVHAFSRLPSGAATFTVAGPAPPWRGGNDYADALEALIQRTQGARSLPTVHPEHVEALLHAHDVLVFPSTWDENAPLVLREAGAAGLRIVASDVAGARAHAPEATFVAPGDTDALADALAAEADRGRGRTDPVAAPTLDEHLLALLARYRGLLG